MSFEIRVISFAEINTFSLEDQWEKAALIPITPERAISQQKNPNALASEPCLWIALSPGKEVLGFAGSLPGYNVHSGERTGWNTCWWADPVRGKEAAMPLLGCFLKQWDLKVAFAEMTARTHAIMEAMGFCHTREEAMLRILFRLPPHKLVQRLAPAGHLAAPFIFPFAAFLNLLFQMRIRRRTKGIRTFYLERRQHIDREIYDYISSHAKNDFYLRSLEEWQWIEASSWLVPRFTGRNKRAGKYPFSYLARSFKREWVLTRASGQLSSVQLLSVRNGFMKVLYYYGGDAGHAIAALHEVIRQSRSVYSLILAHPALLARAEPLKSAGIRTEDRCRYVGISKSLRTDFPEHLHIQMGDGDAVFT
jgi:hypothetical protein